MWVAARRKAIVGALSAALAALAVALSDGGLSGAELPGIALAVLGVGGAVHQVTNKLPITYVLDTTEK